MTSLKRNHSSFIINSGRYYLLVDSGDGISKALMSQGINFEEISGIVISHLHPDHFSGLASLLVQMKLRGRKNELDIFINQAVVEFVKKFLIQSYIYIERMGYEVNFKVFSDEENIPVSDSLTFFSKQNSHLEKYMQYDEEHVARFSCNSFLFQDKDVIVSYTGDIGGEEDLYLFSDKIPDIMISEVSHVPYEKILLAFEKLNAGKLILTHIGDDNEEEIRSYFSGKGNNSGKKISVAYDGMTVHQDKD